MELIGKRICMTKDIGVNDNLFGGYMLCWLDEAAAVFASEVVRGKVVTRKMSEIEFTNPVKVGDMVHIFGSVIKVGNTSIAVKIVAENTTSQKVVCSTDMIFVHIDENGNKKQITQTYIETEV
jgi:acyl-CoA thioesterase YciA